MHCGVSSGLTFLLIWISVGQPGSTHRILGLFPHPGISHFKVFHPIMRGLAQAGHQVTVVSYFPNLDEPLPNYSEYSFEGQQILTNAFSLENFSRRTFWDNFKEFYELARWGYETCTAALNSSAIDRIVEIHKSQPFDLIVTEFFSTDCMVGLSHVLRVPLVGLSSCALMPWHYDRVGLPDSPAYIPSEFSTFSERMSFWERFENWLVTRTVKLLYRAVQWNDNRLLAAKFGGEIPDVRDIAKNTSLILVNQHYTLSGARPLVPAVVEVGGVHIRSQQPLPGEIQKFLDNSPEGVIVISWGSVLKASTLPAVKRDAIISALRRLPFKVLWKWEDDNLQDLPKNVVLKKWLPQRDVLCHPNVRLFMAHGGLLGVSEAVHCAVPVVVTPIYGDQFLNAAALANRGMGVVMHYERITPEYVFTCIQEGLRSEVREAASAVSQAYRHRPHTPLELSVWSIENVLLNGPRRLEKSHGSELSIYAYYSWDVIVVFCLLVFLIAKVFTLVSCVVRKISNRKIIRDEKVKRS
ncbi:UDP-glucosyltransferase 2-like [Malaya genurostris]|uniref:UDP-glucosyltransferase 2-like n=1 Tax=Malaya genurostris TaxID=325434 RepID=UPI0026F3E3EB|nr:UDP-glucosyltransferase 2-like [Malaya genurostris]XP_058453406.1 UDP-glucosyltransferase 2-like [Malaya genurostris]